MQTAWTLHELTTLCEFGQLRRPVARQQSMNSGNTLWALTACKLHKTAWPLAHMCSIACYYGQTDIQTSSNHRKLQSPSLLPKCKACSYTKMHQTLKFCHEGIKGKTPSLPPVPSPCSQLIEREGYLFSQIYMIIDEWIYLEKRAYGNEWLRKPNNKKMITNFLFCSESSTSY